MLLAFERSAVSVRFVSLAIFLTGVRAFECARNSLSLSFGVFTANAFLDLLSHNMLLIWESALLTSCYTLSIIKLASHNAYQRRPNVLESVARTIGNIVDFGLPS